MDRAVGTATALDRARGAEEETAPPRARWPWLVVAGLFVLVLPFDGRISHALWPYRQDALMTFLDDRVRWIGMGHTQIPGLLLLLAIGVVVGRRLLRAALQTTLAFALTAIAVNVIKVLVHRTRPGEFVAPPDHWLGYLRLHDAQSFPSGDTAATFAITLTLGAAFPVARIPLLLLAGVIGIERVLLLSHYPSDVIAGAALGVAVSQFVARPPRLRREQIMRALPFVLLGLFAASVLLSGLSLLPLFGRDESQYAEAAREMLARNDWVTPRVNGIPFFEKPPLYYWMAAISFHSFLPSPLAARLPAALLGIAAVLLTAWIGARAWGVRAGLLAGVVLLTSLQMAVIGRMGIMDVPLTCFTVAALALYARWRRRGGLGHALGFGLLVGAGFLLKGSAGFIPALVAAAHSVVYRGTMRRPWVAPALLAAAAFLAIATPWNVMMAARNGAGFGLTFFVHEQLLRVVRPMQGHGGLGMRYFLFIPAYLPWIFLSFFPWVVFLPAAMRPRQREESEEAARWRGLALVWVGAVLIPFSLISTKLPGYVTPLFPAMALLVGAELEHRLRQPERASWGWAAIGAAALAAFVLLLPLLGTDLAKQVYASAAEVRRLVTPVVLWALAYGIIAVGAMLGNRGQARRGLTGLMVGQMVAVCAVLFGLLPALDPHMEGAREYRAAKLAREQLPLSRVVLYDTRPEAVAFALGHPVPAFGLTQIKPLLGELAKGRTALILPYRLRSANFLDGLPVRRTWKVGDRALLDVDQVTALARSETSNRLAAVRGLYY